jgi:hypothetical protein
MTNGSGKSVLQKLAALASNRSFSDSEGIVVADDFVSFNLHPSRWDTEVGTVLDVEVQCRARGHRIVDWRGAAVLVEGIALSEANSPKNRVWMQFLDASGAARFHDLPLGTFQSQVALLAVPVQEHVADLVQDGFAINVFRKPSEDLSCSVRASETRFHDCKVCLCQSAIDASQGSKCILVELKQDPSLPGRWSTQQGGQDLAEVVGSTFYVLVFPSGNAAAIDEVAAAAATPSRASWWNGVSVAFRGRQTRLAYAACFVGLVGLTAWLLWPRTGPKMAVQLFDSSGVVAITEAGELVSPKKTALPAWCVQRVVELLSSGRVSVAPDMAAVLTNSNADSGLLGTSDAEGRPILIAPHGPAIRSSFPLFRWRGVPGANDYKLVVEHSGAKFAELDSGAATNLAWSGGDPPLLPGETYLWHIETTVRGQPAFSLPVTIYLLRTNQLSELQKLEGDCGGSAILLTAVYETWGLFDEAVNELEEIRRLNPTNQAVFRINEQMRLHRTSGKAP